MLFWVRGGDKTGEQSNRAHEGIRRGERAREIHNSSEDVFIMCARLEPCSHVREWGLEWAWGAGVSSVSPGCLD